MADHFSILFDRNVIYILEQIFLHLDPPDIVNSLKVCKTWQDFIQGFLLFNSRPKKILKKKFDVWHWLNSDLREVDSDILIDKKIQDCFCDGEDLLIRVCHELHVVSDFKVKGVIKNFPAVGKFFAPKGSNYIINNDIMAGNVMIYSKKELKFSNKTFDLRHYGGSSIHGCYIGNTFCFVDSVEDCVKVWRFESEPEIDLWKKFPKCGNEIFGMNKSHFLAVNKKKKLVRLYDMQSQSLAWTKDLKCLSGLKISEMYLTNKFVALICIGKNRDYNTN